MRNNSIVTIFGGTGDLTYRKLLPAFYNLMIHKSLPESFHITIIGRQDLSTEAYHENLKPWLKEHSRFDVSSEQIDAFIEYVSYFKMVFTEDEGYQRLHDFYQTLDKKTPHHKLYYFAVDPSFFIEIAEKLHKFNLSTDASIIIEKPFGNNLEHAMEINDKLQTIFDESHIYRIDHFIAKEMVQNILTLRSTNALFKNIWDSSVVHSIQISAAEMVGVESRGNFYDVTGALKDMVQSHLLQILSIVTMDLPSDKSSEEIHKVQEAVLEKLYIKDYKKDVIYGQYDNYTEEDKVSKTSKIDTFVAIRFEIDNDRWRNVPIFVRTGKKMHKRATEITLQLKAEGHMPANQIVIKVQPDEGVYLKFNIKTPGHSNDSESVYMDFCQSCNLEYRNNTPEAYERLLDAAMQHDQTLFSSIKQVLSSWQLTENIINNTKDNPLHIYKSYTGGPKAATELLEKEDTEWFEDTVLGSLQI
ncbi:MAG: glucose-6-phosphate dehydrogenase [Erysipelothrix sp.]|nr:glucose-6-phosphate dehydrogenase [Erysipelothrix sp.]